MIDKMIKARAGLILDQPFFGSLALRLFMKEDKTCKTAWTDGEYLGYNPEFIKSLTMDQTKGLICHEVMHLAVLHHLRRGDRDKKKWNQAGDYAINQTLVDAKFVLPDDGLLNPAYNGMTAEHIYSLLPDTESSQGGKGTGSSCETSGNNKNNGSGDDNNSDPGGCGEVRDAKGDNGQPASAAELTQKEEEWRVAVSQAAQQAKAMGNLPAELDRLIGEILEPKVDWREVLRRFVEINAKNDYSWMHPNNRYIYSGVYLPSLKSEKLPPIVISVDTSGSIRVEELNQFASEVNAILEDFNTSCTVLYCDTKVSRIEEFDSDNLPVKLNPKGGGGTDFRHPFLYIDENNLSLSCMVYLTDGVCSRFPEQPPYPVLWAIIGKSDFTPPFGEVVKII
jgi:predicted metal-dependent peptidase